MQVATARMSGNRKRQFRILLFKVPAQGCRKVYRFFIGRFGDLTGLRIVKHNAQLAFVLASELAHFERTRLRGSFPVDVPGGVFWHVFANAVEIRPASTHKGLPFASYQRQNLEQLVGRLDTRVNEYLPGKGDAPGLCEKR